MVSNNLAVDSNKLSSTSSNNNSKSNQSSASSLSSISSTLKSSSSSSSASEIKEANFEYDDNEWDVGIGDLISDLDADIEKSNQQQQTTSSTTPLTLSSSLTSATSTNSSTVASAHKVAPSPTINRLQIGSDIKQHLHHHRTSPPTDPLAIPKTANTTQKSVSSLEKQLGASETPTNKYIKQQISGSSTSSNNASGNNNSQTTNSATAGAAAAQAQATMSSGNASGSKSAAKLAVDHQATLDKGLKMKIKRTKPGSKSSEAKHEIVKAEQNGANSLLDDSSGNGSSKSKHSQAASATTPIATAVIPVSGSGQSNKRGSSSHRSRDKAKDKEKSQRDKGGEHPGSGLNDSLHDSQPNGATKSSDSGLSSLSQRLSGSQSNLSSGSSTGGSFSSVSAANSSANAPGPPKDAKVSLVPAIDSLNYLISRLMCQFFSLFPSYFMFRIILFMILVLFRFIVANHTMA